MEVVSLVAEVSGAYQLNVRSLEKDASAGRYEIRIDDLQDRDRGRSHTRRGRAFLLRRCKTPKRKDGRSWRKAIDQYSEALRLMREAGDRRGEAMTLTNIGIDLQPLSEPQKALEYLNQALAVWRAIGDRHLEAITLTINGRVYYALGEPQKALDSYSLALPVMRAVGDQSGEAGTFTQIGTVYRLLGEPQKALDHFAQALPLVSRRG